MRRKRRDREHMGIQAAADAVGGRWDNRAALVFRRIRHATAAEARNKEKVIWLM